MDNKNCDGKLPGDRRWRATRGADLFDFSTTSEHPTRNGECVYGTYASKPGLGLMLMDMHIEAAIEVCKRNGWQVEEIK